MSDLNIDRLSWDDIRIFLACVNEQSFRQAARRLNTSPSTISRRIDRLEKTLGTTLFYRLPDGIVLTDQAQAIKESAIQMEQSIFDVMRNKQVSGQGASGSVTIAVTEGIGAYWVVPNLVALNRQYPKIDINLQCQMKCVNVSRMEADMAIQAKRPDNDELIMVKVGRLHAYPFASQKYIDTHGIPQGIKDMKKHRWIKLIASQVHSKAWLEKTGLDSFDELPGMTTNTSTTVFNAIDKGLGIGILPTYTTALGGRMVPVDMGLSHSYDLWLTYHPSVRDIVHKKIVMKWLKSIFDGKTYPWFRD